MMRYAHLIVYDHRPTSLPFTSLRLPQFLIFILLDLNRSDTLFLILTCFDLWVSGRRGFIFNTSPVDAFILYTLDLEGLHIMFISLHSYAWLLPYSLYSADRVLADWRRA